MPYFGLSPSVFSMVPQLAIRLGQLAPRMMKRYQRLFAHQLICHKSESNRACFKTDDGHGLRF